MVYFRACLLANKKEETIFKETFQVARETGLLKKEGDKFIDSIPLLEAGGVKDGGQPETRTVKITEFLRILFGITLTLAFD